MTDLLELLSHVNIKKREEVIVVRQRKFTLMFIICITVLMLSLFVQPIAHAQTAASGPTEELVVGMLSTLTGPMSFIGESLQRGTEWGFREINESGGILIQGKRYKVRLIAEDDKYSPEEAVKAANKLIFTDKVKYIVGPIGSAPALALAATCEQNKVFHLAGSFTTELTAPGKNTYSVRACPFIPALQIGAMVNKFKETYPNIKTVAAIAPDDATGNSVVAVAGAEFKRSGIQLIEVVKYARETKEHRPLISALLSKKPQALWTLGPPPEHVVLQVREARFQGFKGPIWNTGSVLPANLIEAVGASAAEGFVSSWGDPVGDGAPSGVKKFASQFIAKYGNKSWYPDVEMAYTWAFLLKKGLETANSLDPTAVRDQFLKKGFALPTAYGPGYMQDRELLRPIQFATIKKGKPVNFPLAYPPGYPTKKK